MIYIILLTGICFLSLIRKKLEQKKIIDFIILIIMTLIYGVRYDVGIDYLAYASYYDDIYGIYGEREPLFELTMEVFRTLGMPFWAYSCFLGFLIFYLLYLISKDLDIGYDKIIILFILTGQLFVSFNLVRQTVAVILLMFAFRYITNSNFIRYTVFVCIATLFHSSAFIFLFLYFIKRVSWNMRYNFILIIIGAVLLLTNIMDPLIVSLVPDKYIDYLGGRFDHKVEIGLGVLFYISVVILIGFHKINNQSKLFPFAIVYVLGYSIFLFTLNSFIIARLTRYCGFALIPVLAYVLCKPMRKGDALGLMNYGAIIVYVLIFIGSIVGIYGSDPNNLMYQTIFSL